MYSPSLGRFMQTDPIGYADGMNWYDYVGSDPVNALDPSGLCTMTNYTKWHVWPSEGRWEKVDSWAEKSGCDTNPALVGFDGGTIVVRATKGKKKPQMGNRPAELLEDRCYLKSTVGIVGPMMPFEADDGQILTTAIAKWLQHQPGTGKSYFVPTYTANNIYVDLVKNGLAGGVTVSSAGRPGRSVRLTFATGHLVGWDRGSGKNTQYLTAIFTLTGSKGPRGLNFALLTSVYPGC